MDDHERQTLEDELARLRAREAELSARADRAEQEARASRALHEATIESLPFDFWARDREGYCFSQNATAVQNWGDLLHKRPEDMPLPRQVIEGWLANNRRTLAGEIVDGEAEYSIHGETRFIRNVLGPIRMGDAIVGTLGVNIDVTEQRRALLALRDSEENLRVAVDAAGMGLWSWDTERDELTWDARLSAMYGLAPGASPCRLADYLALVHPDDRASVSSRITEGIASHRWEDEYRIVRADGEVRWVMTKKTVVSDGGRLRVRGAVIDVTERRLRDEQIRQAQKLEAVGQLAAGIAHNFNNMLMGVMPNLELAIRGSSGPVVPLLENAIESTRRAADLVRRLMTYAGRNRPAARTLEDLALLVARTVDLCRAMVDRSIVFEESYEAGAGVCVDAAQIEQAVLNVLINARDALERPGVVSPQILVSVAVVAPGAVELEGRPGEHVRVRVADNGVGMAAATVARIYEPFFTTKDPGRGTGLGLATAQAILREHEGFIACASEPGKGATFSLYLHRGSRKESSANTSDGSTRSAPQEAPVGGTETLLVVDDEPRVRQVVCLLLRAAGYVVREAASGSEVLELLSRPEVAASVSLVLLDVSLPGPPRLELRSKLRQLTRARVVYFTGYAFEAADADDVVLEKPASEDKLLRTIRRALDARD